MAGGSPQPPGHPWGPFSGDMGTRRCPAPAMDTPIPAQGDTNGDTDTHCHQAGDGCRLLRWDGCPQVGPGPSASPSHLSPFHDCCTALVLPWHLSPLIQLCASSPHQHRGLQFPPPIKLGASWSPWPLMAPATRMGPFYRQAPCAAGTGSLSKAGLFPAEREPRQAQHWHCVVLWGDVRHPWGAGVPTALTSMGTFALPAAGSSVLGMSRKAAVAALLG